MGLFAPTPGVLCPPRIKFACRAFVGQTAARHCPTLKADPLLIHPQMVQSTGQKHIYCCLNQCMQRVIGVAVRRGHIEGPPFQLLSRRVACGTHRM